MLSTSTVAYRSMRDLTWASHWIVQGRVVEICPPAEDRFGGYQDYVLEVDKLYRGWPVERIVVRNHDLFGGLSEMAPEQQLGDDVILFLAAGEDGETYPVGGLQGRWELDGDRAWAGYCCSTGALALDELEQLIAFSQAEGPTEHMPGEPVSAPEGPDLPQATERPAGCGGILTGGNMGSHAENVADLAWYSHQIIAGTVVQQLPSIQATTYPDFDPIFRPIVTDYLVRVDERIRGIAAETIRVRQLGGTLDDCTLTNRDGHALAAGERLLLFASTTESGSADPTYYLTSGSASVWRFDDTGTLVSNWTPSEDSPYPPSELPVIPLAELLEYFRTVLTDPPPTKYALIPSIVSPEEAPISVPAWPEPAEDPGQEWTRYQHPVDGWSLDYPSGWTLIAPGRHSSTTTFASYASTGEDDEQVPAREMRVDLQQTYGPSRQVAHIFTVGDQEYPGFLYGYDDPYKEKGYQLSILYYAEGNHFRLTARFSDPPDLADPNLLLFFQLADSIIHTHPPPAS